MKKIGIIPGIRLKPDWYEGEFFFKDTFITRITETGGMPVGILPVHGVIENDQLDMCDAFVMQGGQRIMPCHLQAIDYALRHDKRLLGVCLGMQAMHTYFVVMEEKEKREFEGSFLELFELMKKEHYYFVEPVENHNSPPQQSYADENIHTILVKKGTRLSGLIPDGCKVASRHSYRITKPADKIAVSAIADDGETIEGIEFGDKLIGVQFHPELNQDYMSLFRFVTDAGC